MTYSLGKIDIARHAQLLNDKRKLALAMVNEEETALEEAKHGYEINYEAQLIVQHVSQIVQSKAHERIAAVVSRCLTAVFEYPFDFAIRFDRKRGRTEAVLTFLQDGNEISPTFGSGGGALDVAGFALRLACLSLTRPPQRKVLFLDEPFRHVHGEGNRERVRMLVETLPRELNVQVTIVTGLEWLVCGKVVKL